MISHRCRYKARGSVLMRVFTSSSVRWVAARVTLAISSLFSFQSSPPLFYHSTRISITSFCLRRLACTFKVFLAWRTEGIEHKTAVWSTHSTMCDTAGDGIGITRLQVALVSRYVQRHRAFDHVAKLFVGMMVVGQDSTWRKVHEREHDTTPGNETCSDAFDQRHFIDRVHCIESRFEG